MSRIVKLMIVCLTLSLAATQALGFPGAAGTPDNSQSQPAQGTSLSGTIVETMDAASYTYLCLESGGQKQWAAIPATPVTIGSEVALAPGAVMTNFSSRSLGRTFDTIIFSRGILKN